jgi:DUF2934 family protein
MEHPDETIRERAYQLWIADGRPDGNSDAYWLNAQREMLLQSIGRAGAEAPVSATAEPGEKPKVKRPRKRKRGAA